MHKGIPQSRRRSLLSLGAALLGAGAFGRASGADPAPAPAAPAVPQAPQAYSALRTAQPTAGGGKVEVIEFFAYSCPHCNAFEPLLAGWVKRQGDNIVFKRIHVERGPDTLPQERLFHTLEALGQLDAWHDKVYAAMHSGGWRFRTDEEVIDWAAQNGFDRARFTAAYRSFGVEAKVRRIPAQMSAYAVDRWPFVVVDGRWVTSPSHVAQAMGGKGDEALHGLVALQVMDSLVGRAKSAAPAAAPAAATAAPAAAPR